MIESIIDIIKGRMDKVQGDTLLWPAILAINPKQLFLKNQLTV